MTRYLASFFAGASLGVFVGCLMWPFLYAAVFYCLDALGRIRFWPRKH
jgi:hypothetical protein